VHGRSPCTVNALDQVAGCGIQQGLWVGVVTAHEKLQKKKPAKVLPK